MATVTSIGPIGARQINNNLYVGRSDLTTIQSAVTAAVTLTGFFIVVIPYEYAGTDLIAAVTGGTTDVEILDQRLGQSQMYFWNGSQYIPRRLQQLSGFVSMGQPAMIPTGSATFYFAPSGTSGAGTAHIDVTANAGMGMPGLNINGIPSDGNPVVTFMRLQNSTAAPGITSGIPEIEMPSQLSLFNGGFDSFNLWIGDYYLSGNKGMTIWARADENAIDFQGETIGGAYDQTIRLNYLGGNVQIGPIIFSAIGDIVGVGDIAVSSIAADDADFDTCEVNNSPVRTFANTPDGPGEGMVWPPDGVPVSLGDHWQSPSIDPATLATWPAAGIPVSTGSGWGTSISPGSLASYPPAGIAVSTGTAWGTSIPAANVAVLNQFNTFTEANNFTHNSLGSATAPTTGFQITWNLSNGQGETDYINSNGGAAGAGGGFSWFNVAPGAVLTPSAVPGMKLDSSGRLNVINSIVVLPTTTQLILDTEISVHPSARLSALNTASTAIRGGFEFVGYSSNFSQTGTYLLMYQDATGVHSQFPTSDLAVPAPITCANNHIVIYDRALGTGYTTLPNMKSDGTNLILNASTTGSTFLNLDSGQNVFFGNGSASVNATGGGTFVSVTVSGSKAFLIPHPLDDSKDLKHACLEGPENGVYYRGESATANGWAEITLPDYFEALTMKENRCVMLTALFEDDSEPISSLAASRVKDGKFRVWSGIPAQKFYWQVIAVRGDIEPLEVEPERQPEDPQLIALRNSISPEETANVK